MTEIQDDGEWRIVNNLKRTIIHNLLVATIMPR
jgi:hypothetical protein